jgi:hypothetical protein
MSTKKLEVGDVVWFDVKILNSLFTIEKIEYDYAYCVWFDKEKKLHRARFDISDLALVKQEI